MDDFWTASTLVWVVQVLVIALLIHVSLRFVRATRGNRLIRGVLVGVLGGYLGLRVFAALIEAEELAYLLEASTGFLVVALAIVFQTELRRGIAQIGERSLIGRLMHTAGRDSLTQVAKASVSMASQRIGALIAFERETSLRSYIEEGTPIDADVNARLLESLFHPGTALHDGAVIVKGDRIAAAGCFFPLPQDADLDASLGTRHRAAVGITEDTDSVVIVVSEETGRISIAREGQITSKIEPAKLEEALKRILQDRDTPRGLRRPSLMPSKRKEWVTELSWLAGALALATSVMYLSREELIEHVELSVEIRSEVLGGQVLPKPREVLVVLPDEDLALTSPRPNVPFTFRVEGTRGDIERFRNEPAGLLDLTTSLRNAAPKEGARPGDTSPRYLPLDLERVVWNVRTEGLSFTWVDAPQLTVERIALLELNDIDLRKLLPEPRTSARQYDENNIRFDLPGMTGVALRGPAGALEEFGEAPNPKQLFQTLNPTSAGPDHDVALLQLTPEVRARGITLEDAPVRIHLPKATAEWVVRTITVEVALVCLDPDRVELLERWRLPDYAQEVRLDIISRGLATEEEMVSGSPAASERLAELEKYVRRSVYVFADLAELAEGESSVLVRYGLRDQDWREWVAPILLEDDQDGTREWSRDALQLRLDGEARILLEAISD